ncbi:MAG: arginine--tRNA ligase, partial [Oscillospiraceae bacterium]|nr:arginine--tRNA ligase [Oscillospiraceae bacterium]
MTNLRLYLTKLVSEAFELAGYDGALGVVTASNRPDLCQFQCNGAMSAAKIYKQKPISIAEAVTEKLSALCSMLSAFAVAPGFININVSDELLAERMNAMLTDERLLLPKTDESKTIVLDYGGPNVAKNLHVGHLRPAIIGDALYRIGKFLGYNVISDIHLGDWGLPMGLVIVALLERGINIRDLSLDELNAIYPDASARSKEDEEFAEEAQRVTRELQQGNEQYRKIWEEIREISIADAKSNYDALNVRDFDYWYGESTAQPYVADVIAMLTERGLLKDDDGAQIVAVKRDDDKEPIPPLIILKRGRAM